MAPGFTAKSALGREGVTIARPFCRITGFLSPVPNSKIGFEVWLPEPKAWNRKYFGSGNGGWTGAFAYQGISGPLARGYAVMTTDQGHTNDPGNPVEDVTWALAIPSGSSISRIARNMSQLSRRKRLLRDIMALHPSIPISLAAPQAVGRASLNPCATRRIMMAIFMAHRAPIIWPGRPAGYGTC
jgi:hypothetical protein